MAGLDFEHDDDDNHRHGNEEDDNRKSVLPVSDDFVVYASQRTLGRGLRVRDERIDFGPSIRRVVFRDLSRLGLWLARSASAHRSHSALLRWLCSGALYARDLSPRERAVSCVALFPSTATTAIDTRLGAVTKVSQLICGLRYVPVDTHNDDSFQFSSKLPLRPTKVF